MKLSVLSICLTIPFIFACKMPVQKEAVRLPNIVLIFCDDLGYGDLGVYGSTLHRTPNLDRMAAEGIRFTDYYVTSSVCTPSRSSLMTGCYPRRVNMHQNARPPNDGEGWMVLFPVAQRGLHPNEITIPEILKQKDYATACIGKWHLGDQIEFLPTRQGFDYYYGIPYSNDMGTEQFDFNPPLPLLQNEEVIEAPAVQSNLTKRYTAEAIQFIEKNKDGPFFLYLPHTFPHDPLFASEDFLGKSNNGIYGDAIEELDWSTGEILNTINKLGIDDNTLVIFTSDNGASSHFGGNNGPLSGWKGDIKEGGLRVPCIARWPGQIAPGVLSNEIITSMDFLPTFAHLAKARVPNDRIIDGMNMWAHFNQDDQDKKSRDAFFYYKVEQLQAVRSGRWKLYLERDDWRKISWNLDREQSEMKLYDLESDLAELKNVASNNPQIVKQLLSMADEMMKAIGDTKMEGANQRPAGHVQEPVALLKR